MSEILIEILQRISFFIFIIAGIAPILFSLTKYVSDNFPHFKQYHPDRIKWGMLVVIILSAAFWLINGFMPKIYQSLGVIGAIIGILLSILIGIITSKKKDISYLRYLIISFMLVFLSLTIYMLSLSYQKQEVQIIYKEKYFSVNDLVGFYKGRIKSNIYGESIANLTIIKVLSTKDSVILAYSITTASNNDLGNYRGTGRIFLEKEMIEFTGYTNCKIDLNDDLLTLTSVDTNNLNYWDFKRKIR